MKAAKYAVTTFIKLEVITSQQIKSNNESLLILNNQRLSRDAVAFPTPSTCFDTLYMSNPLLATRAHA